MRKSGMNLLENTQSRNQKLRDELLSGSESSEVFLPINKIYIKGSWIDLNAGSEADALSKISTEHDYNGVPLFDFDGYIYMLHYHGRKVYLLKLLDGDYSSEKSSFVELNDKTVFTRT